MANLYLRKKSKRQSTKQRVKVEKKVRDHKKKIKKQQKKGILNKKGKKKDPGIPQILPFRDEVLEEVEAFKQRREDERQKKKEARKEAKENLLNEKRNLADIMQDGKAKQDAYDRMHNGEQDTDSADTPPLKSSKTMKPENSRKTFFKEFKKVVDAADVVLQVLDARDPLGSRCLEVEEAVRMSPGNKRLVLVLNKIDLVPKDNVELWLKHLRKELPAVAFKASTQQQRSNLTRSRVSYNKASKDLMKSSHCLGADVLMKLLGNYCRNTEMSINVGVVGFPNTGKSSIINSLKRARACNVGAIPGITKVMQTVMLDKHIKLLDSPGVVMTNSPTETAGVLRNVVRLESLIDPVPGVDAILSRCQKSQMITHYRIPNYHNTTEFLTYLAARFGKLKKGGVPDVTKAARRLLHDWNSGTITYYTSPPEDNSASHHIEASIVTQWGKEFDIDEIVKEESNSILKDLNPATDKHFLISPFNPLKGVVTEEQDQAVADVEFEENDDVDNDDDEEDMEDDDDDEEELKGVTVDIDVSDKKTNGKGQKQPAVKDLSYRHKGPQPAKPLEKVGGLIMKKSLRDLAKKEKKKKKRAGALAGKLSDAMSNAFSAFSGMGSGGGGDEDGDGDYNFGTDFK